MGRRNRRKGRDCKEDALNGSDYSHDSPRPPESWDTGSGQHIPLERVDTPTSPPATIQGAIRRSLIQEDSRISLLEQLYVDPRLPEDDEVRKYVEELGLLPTAIGSDQPARINWTVEQGTISRVQLPDHEKHSSAFEWIGEEREKYPTYLWDSHDDRTVLAQPERLQEGYIAVSWTWGRYQKRDADGQPTFRASNTVPWQLPVIPAEGRQSDLIRALKDSLKRIRAYRYFWVDVLCIHQQKGDEKRHEIEKQAGIFGGAKAVICFLWTLNQPSHLVEPLEGLGELLGWALNFGEREKEKKSIDSWTDSFERLRNENWFSSLWALQEIVLAPAGVWMTRTGDVCSLNGRVLTTRLMATVLRILCWAGRRRVEVWRRAEHDFATTVGGHRKDLAKFKGRHKAKQIETRKAMRDAIKRQNALATSNNARSFAPAPLRSSFLSLFHQYSRSSDDLKYTLFTDGVRRKTFEDAPWIINRQDAEEVLCKQIGHWTNWAFGTACIDVSLSATRAAIIIATTNRSIVPGNAREPALLAALKVEPNDQLLPQNTSGPTRHARHNSRHLSPLLMNVILSKEGLGLFNVAHRMEPSLKHIGSDDFVFLHFPPIDGTVDIIHVQDASFDHHLHPVSSWRHITRRQTRLSDVVRYQQRGEEKATHRLPSDGSALCDMSPDTATAMNLQALPFVSGRLYHWLSSECWHIHEDGGLHIPFGARIQKLKRPKRRDRQKLAAFVQLNGSEGEPHAIYTPDDLNIICRTQDWLLSLLGQKQGKLKARFLFLPLGFHEHAAPLQAQRHSVDEITITESRSIGVVLVTKAKNSKDQSMTCWYKIGTYVGTTELEDSTLEWKDGIMVTSFKGEDHIQTREPAHCLFVEDELKLFFGRLEEAKDGMNGTITEFKPPKKVGTAFVGKTIPKEVPLGRKVLKMLTSSVRLIRDVGNLTISPR